MFAVIVKGLLGIDIVFLELTSKKWSISVGGTFCFRSQGYNCCCQEDRFNGLGILFAICGHECTKCPILPQDVQSGGGCYI